MTGDLIPDEIMNFYNGEKKLDKQSYKELLSDEIIESSENRDTLKEIWQVVKENPNDMKLGSVIREMYREKNKKSSS